MHTASMTWTADGRICCRQLDEALRHGPAAGDTFFLGFGEGGAPFYKVGNMQGGQLTSVFTEPLVFCPFCGCRVRGDAPEFKETLIGPASAGAKDEDEVMTRVSSGRTMEIETVLALGRQGPGADAGAGEF